MKNLYILLFFLVIFPQNLEAQTDADVCDLQVDFIYAICIDSPGGCYVYKTVVSGGTPPYSYAWSTGTTQNEYTFAPASTYGGTCESVTITDGNGCVAVTAGIWGDYSETSFTIGSDTLIALNTLINFDLSTNDVFDTIDYQLIKAPLFGTLEFENNGTGTYTPLENYCGPDYFQYLARDTACHYSAIQTVHITNGPCADIILTKSDCNESCSGSAYFYQEGFYTLPLSFLWSDGSTADSIQNLCAGEISVTVTDDTSLSDVYSAIVTPASLEASIVAVDEACENQTVQFESAYLQAPEGEIHFYWDSPFSNEWNRHDSIFNRQPGYPDSINIFSLELRSSNGCLDTAYHTITSFDAPFIESIEAESLICPDDTIRLYPEVEDGTLPYSYHWIGPQDVQSSMPNLTVPSMDIDHTGMFRLLVMDANSCYRLSNHFYDDEEDTFTHSVNAYSLNNTLCLNSDTELRFGMSPSWRVPDLVEWTGPNGFYSNEHRPPLHNLTAEMAGFYTITAHFGSTCSTSDSTEIKVGEFEGFVEDFTIIPPTTCYSDDGELTLTMSFPPPYEINPSWTNWSPDQTTNPFTLTGLDDGAHQHILIERDGCDIQQQLNVPKPNIPTIEINYPDCINDSITGQIFSPNAPLVGASWSEEDSAWDELTIGLVANDLNSSSYSVFIRDSVTNCTFSEDIVIEPLLDFAVNIVQSASTCFSFDGILQVEILGDITPPVSYQWSNGTEGITAENLSTGWYSLIITDGLGCSLEENIYLPTEQACFSVIKGNVFFNEDCDCIEDENDSGFEGVEVCIEAVTESYSDCVDTDSEGAFTIIAPFIDEYIITAHPSQDFPEETCAPELVVVFNDTTNVENTDFFYCSETITDLSISSYCGTPRPGFTQNHTFRLTNMGTDFVGEFSLVVDLSDSLEISTIEPIPSSHDPITNIITWDFDTILFNTFEDFKVGGTVPLYVQLGDIMSVTAALIDVEGDTNLNNNSDYCERVVVGSYDPNDKTVSPVGKGDAGNITELDTTLTYTVRFQNTGTDTAFTVVIRDTLDASVFDLSSIQPRISSHEYILEVEEENILVFTFNDIDLVDSTSSSEDSQGYVVFKINLLDDLPLETLIENSAAIYFDFNEPIITNTATNFLTRNKNIIQKEVGLFIAPNPVDELTFATIFLEDAVKNANLELYSIAGNKIKTLFHTQQLKQGESSFTIDLSQQVSGIYILRLQTEIGSSVVKIVKID